MGTYQLLEVFGEDYGTADGSAIRDYVHVVDVAKAHTKAVKKYQVGPSNINQNCSQNEPRCSIQAYCTLGQARSQDLEKGGGLF